jgi:polyhydroxyalkanoate synthesis regulator phasin
MYWTILLSKQEKFLYFSPQRKEAQHMGFRNELRKLFFAGKSVGKSGAKKAEDFIEEKAEKLGDAAADTRERTEELFEQLEEKAADVWASLDRKSTENEAGSQPPPDAEDAPEEDSGHSRVRDAMSEAAGEAWEATQELSEKVGKEVLEKGSELWEKTKEVSEELGEKLLDKGEEVYERGRAYLDKMSEKAEAAAREEEAMRQDPYGYKQQAQESEQRAESAGSESLLDGMDDFFDKASRFADGDYHNTGKARPMGNEEPEEGKENKGRVKGFEDLDGDGDELIDDAILDGEEE